MSDCISANGGALTCAPSVWTEMAAPAWALLAAVGVALASGLVFGVMPARRAARLDPVAALSRR